MIDAFSVTVGAIGGATAVSLLWSLAARDRRRRLPAGTLAQIRRQRQRDRADLRNVDVSPDPDWDSDVTE